MANEPQKRRTQELEFTNDSALDIANRLYNGSVAELRDDVIEYLFSIDRKRVRHRSAVVAVLRAAGFRRDLRRTKADANSLPTCEWSDNEALMLMSHIIKHHQRPESFRRKTGKGLSGLINEWGDAYGREWVAEFLRKAMAHDWWGPKITGFAFLKRNRLKILKALGQLDCEKPKVEMVICSSGFDVRTEDYDEAVHGRIILRRSVMA